MKNPLTYIFTTLTTNKIAAKIAASKIIQKIKNNTTKQKAPIITAIIILIIITIWLLTGSKQTVIIAGQNNQTNIQNIQNIKLPPQKVKSFISKAQKFQPKLKITGKTVASRTLNIKSEITSRIKQINVDVGDIVEQNTILVIFETEDKEAQLKQAEANFKKTNKEYQIIKQLSKKGFKSELNTLQAEAEKAQANAKLAEMKKQFQNIKIKAPYKAIVTKKHAEVGDYLQQGNIALSIIEANPLILEMQIAEKNFYDVKIGQKIKTKIANNQQTTATIKTISPLADTQTRTFTIKAEIQNKNYQHPVGTTAAAEILLKPQLAHKIKASHLSLNDKGILGIKIKNIKQAKFIPVNIIGDEAGTLWITGKNLQNEIIIIAQGQGFVSDGQEIVTTPSPQEEIFENIDN